MFQMFRRRFLATIKYLVLCISSFMALLPLYSCFILSFKESEEITYDTILELPKNPLNFANYKYVFTSSDFLKAFLNSAIIMLIVLTISTAFSAMVAYSIYRLGFRWKRSVIWLYLVGSLIPSISLQIPIFQLMSSLQMINTLYGYILVMCGADIVSIYIFGNFYQEVPKTIDKAALLDGCSTISLFFRVHLPMLKPAFLTSAIVKGVYVYNEYYMANLYLLDKKKLPTATTELYSYLGPFGNSYNIICAACIIVVLPIIIVFVLSQKRIYSGFSGIRNY